ncbi:uncharacterized protein LOC126773649 [Nymphalis io]|uniref:uncharacterized protein LOC126773649 n=1 Tax=Inachis io TaxID=171585 RepID=UPI002167BF0B|nr:uncharacterized protein LOC126773649 [Nymphalis io]XP_050350615.1 uncharacterized protein LOC126773649 [Nymphalis io]
MCCIFTCCGWMVDLIQRLWTFTMSCCISSAVCCSLLTASMSGVALGYNYSLAEYIDLKETNVSVYLKRGIFDDDIADDMDWRRSGHQPVGGHIGENNLMTGSNDETSTLRSGRRLDDSIYESNDRNNFEGSLMRLTAKAPDPSPSAETSEVPLSELIKDYPTGSLDQLKAVQSAINMRKAAALARRMNDKIQKTQFQNDRNQPQDLRDINNRRAMKFDVPPFEDPSTISSLREAVPDTNINDPSKWFLPKIPYNKIPKDILYADDYASPTYPQPVTPKPGPIRPTRPKQTPRTRPSSTTVVAQVPSRSAEPNLPKSIDEEMESFKDKFIINKLDTAGMSDDEFLKKIRTGAKKSDDDYDEDIKGVPLRRKRSNDLFFTSNKSSHKSTKENKEDIVVGSSTLRISSQETLIKLLFSSTIS